MNNLTPNGGSIPAHVLTVADHSDNLVAHTWRKSAPDECAYFSALCWSIADATVETLDRLRPSDFKHPTSALICEAAQAVRANGRNIDADTLADECARRSGLEDGRGAADWDNARDALAALTAPTKGKADDLAAQLSRTIAPHSADDWSEPLPLKNSLYPAPALDGELIPLPLQGWVWDCAQRIGVAPDYIVVSAIVAAASLVGNTVSIRPKRRDDWRVVPNLWGALVGSPSVKKSPAIAEGTKPLARLKALEIERHREAAKEFEGEALLNEIGADALKAELKKLKKAGAERDELKAYIEQMQEIENAAPTLKTYSVQDATIEALTKVLERNPRGFLIERDELIGWLRALEKQGHEQDRAFYLEAFNGTAKNQQIERVGRGTVIVPSCTISILGTIQPAPFAQLIRAASAGGGGADGFIARFQMLVYPDPLPKYKHVDQWPDADAKNRAFAIFEKLDALTPESAGAQCDDDEAPFLRFDVEAQGIFDGWLIALENRLPMLGVLIEQHLAKYRSLMPSLALLFHLIAVADGTAKAGAVGAEAAAMAADWCDFLEAHARRIYAMAVDGATDGAELIASRFGQLPNPFTLRDVHQKGWAGLSNRGDVDNALARLEERGWIRADDEPTGESGGRPTTSYSKHPSKAGEK
jgi:putative DNA primase/helicase